MCLIEATWPRALAGCCPTPFPPPHPSAPVSQEEEHHLVMGDFKPISQSAR